MKTVTMYSTATCKYCKLAEKLFDEHKVPYTKIDVGADADQRKIMIEKSGQMGVPVIFVGTEMTVGFDKPKLTTLLGL